MDFDDAAALAYLSQEHKNGRIQLRAVTVTNSGVGLPGLARATVTKPTTRLIHFRRSAATRTSLLSPKRQDIAWHPDLLAG